MASWCRDPPPRLEFRCLDCRTGAEPSKNTRATRKPPYVQGYVSRETSTSTEQDMARDPDRTGCTETRKNRQNIGDDLEI